MPIRASLPERSSCETGGFIARRAARIRGPTTFFNVEARVFFKRPCSRRERANNYSDEEYYLDIRAVALIRYW